MSPELVKNRPIWSHCALCTFARKKERTLENFSTTFSRTLSFIFANFFAYLDHLGGVLFPTFFVLGKTWLTFLGLHLTTASDLIWDFVVKSNLTTIFFTFVKTFFRHSRNVFTFFTLTDKFLESFWQRLGNFFDFWRAFEWHFGNFGLLFKNFRELKGSFFSPQKSLLLLQYCSFFIKQHFISFQVDSKQNKIQCNPLGALLPNFNFRSCHHLLNVN